MLFNSSDEDITQRLLTYDGPMFWLISPKLESADDKNIDAINNVFDYAQEKGYPFYCITGSSKESINEWMNNTGSEYPFCNSDDVMLKTMIRSNPGLILLKNGTILAKWNPNDIPDEDYIKGTMDNYLSGNNVKEKEDDGLLFIFIKFCLTFAPCLGL